MGISTALWGLRKSLLGSPPSPVSRDGSRICERGVQIYQGGLFLTFFLIFHKFPHETEIIWSKPPLNPTLGSGRAVDYK